MKTFDQLLTLLTNKLTETSNDEYIKYSSVLTAENIETIKNYNKMKFVDKYLILSQ